MPAWIASVVGAVRFLVGWVGGMTPRRLGWPRHPPGGLVLNAAGSMDFPERWVLWKTFVGLARSWWVCFAIFGRRSGRDDRIAGRPARLAQGEWRALALQGNHFQRELDCGVA